jgi:hypothetical protein
MKQPFYLGQKVTVQATVEFHTGHDPWKYSMRNPMWTCLHTVQGPGCTRNMFRCQLDHSLIGTIIGYTFKQTGTVVDNDEVSFFQADKYHKVWRVATTVRWKEPLLCLETDIDDKVILEPMWKGTRVCPNCATVVPMTQEDSCYTPSGICPYCGSLVQIFIDYTQGTENIIAIKQ